MNYRFQCSNGMNFRKAVNNPNSNISRIVNYLRLAGPQTKKTILVDGLSKFEAVKHDTSRGYASYTFGLAVKLGILTYSRVGRRIVWELGPMADRVIHV